MSETRTYPGKRVLDLALGAVAALVFAPVIGAIAVAIWFDDHGPTFFTQARIGAQRETFRIIKFRSMRDGHVTRVGRWLRRTGLDELPQFVNVCRGEMSIVGPRPMTPDDVARLKWSNSDHDWRFAMKPGITGLAQLAGGRSARHSSRLDRLYEWRMSAALDIRIIALSFIVNIVGKKTVRHWITLRPRSAGMRVVASRPEFGDCPRMLQCELREQSPTELACLLAVLNSRHCTLC